MQKTISEHRSQLRRGTKLGGDKRYTVPRLHTCNILYLHPRMYAVWRYIHIRTKRTKLVFYTGVKQRHRQKTCYSSTPQTNFQKDVQPPINLQPQRVRFVTAVNQDIQRLSIWGSYAIACLVQNSWDLLQFRRTGTDRS